MPLLVVTLGVMRFEFGAWNPLVLWLVRGTWTDGIALIEPDWASVVYDSEPADGPGVGTLRTTYRTRAASDVVLERFTHGCAQIGLTAGADPSPDRDGGVLRSCAQDDRVIVLQVTGQDVAVREDVP
ncbi:MAG TPA: hypothetical protein VIL09_18380 [Microvirga sp.]